MRDEDKTKQQLTGELAELRQRVTELEAADTERNKAEEQTRESERRYRLLAENVTDIIMMLDLNLNIAHVSPSVESTLGYSVEEAKAQGIGGMLTPPSLEVATKALAEELAVEEMNERDLSRSRTVEVETIHKDGSTIWAEAKMTFLRDQDDRAVAILGVVRDITEPKKVEHALNERVKELRCLYGIAETAARPGITSDEICQEVAHLLVMSWQYPAIACARVTHDGEECRTKNYRETEWKQSSDIKVPGKTIGIVEVRYLEERPVADEGPFLKEERALIDAVAERLGKLAQRRKAETELRIKDSAISSSINAIAISDLEGNLTYVNRSFLELWGYDSDDEVLGKSAVGFWLSPESVREIFKTLEGKGSWAGELTAKRKDGSTFDIYLSASMIVGETGEPISMMASFVDITERKRAEKEKEKTQAQLRMHLRKERQLRRELEEQDEARNQFVSLLAHELKSPLTAVLPSAELMLDELNESSPLYPLAQNLYSNASNLNQRVSELLDFVSMQSPSFSLSPQFVDVQSLVRRVAAQMSPLLEEKRQNLALDFVNSLPKVETDPARIEQVLFNLLTNASKFSPREADILVRAKKTGDHIQIDVEDAAKPIEASRMELIFRPYYRDDRTKNIPGLGLGLSICRRLVDLQGGSIWVQTGDKGNIFSFTLPLKGRQAHRGENPKSRA